MKVKRFLRVAALGIVGGVFLSTAAAPAQIASDVSAFGAAGVDPVVIGGAWTFSCASPSSFDFGPRHVVFDAGAFVETNGCVVQAARITVAAGATLHGAVTLRTNAANSTHDGGVIVAGLIDASGDAGADGGNIFVEADGELFVSAAGVLVARPGAGWGRRGGRIDLAASEIVVAASATPFATGDSAMSHFGGEIHIVAENDVFVSRSLKTFADRAGGSVEIVSTGASITIDGAIDTRGLDLLNDHYDAGASGGAVVIAAAGDVVLTRIVRTTANGTGGDSGAVHITAGGAATVKTIDTRGGGGGAAVTVVAGGSYFQSGSVLGYSTYDESYGSGNGGNVSINAGGSLRITGSVNVYGGNGGYPSGGHVALVAVDDVEVGPIYVDGYSPGSVSIVAQNGDVTTGSISSASIPWEGTSGGSVVVFAGGSANVAAINVPALEFPGRFSLTAGDDADVGPISAWSLINCPPSTYVECNVGGTLEINGGVAYGTCASLSAPIVLLTACRMRINGAIGSYLGSDAGGRLRFVVGDVMSVRASISALQFGVVEIVSRLGAPYAPTIESGGSIEPPPDFTHDPTMPPCLALDRATWSAPAAVIAGEPLLVTLHGRMNSPVLAGAAFAFGQVGLGALGCTQIDPFTAFRLADPGILGPALPASTTDASGTWTFAAVTPLGLTGLSLVFDGYVFDPTARNGVFDQPPAAVVTIL